ncbi:PH domain-containing protein [Demequina lignilytica]|uniref:PH domain-containing protein n=1 Tax=Demequina lignilytica TaxID=3051663 RepID=A0AB35MKC5_9MICO|nr:PH domain-containing protein [Demequina sp. SYSU T0a273]MDN4484213.1 PH domain-containing protein [Demequina sp. SYSU T0a273]
MTQQTFRAPREWTRVHPVSPLLGGWAVIGILLAYFIHQRLPDIIAGTSFDSAFEFADQFPLLWIVLAAILGFAVTILVSVWQWRRTEYRIGDDAVYLRQGIITQQQRQARLDRLQAVDVVQPLLARIFGFAAINVQVAGGSKSGVELRYLRLGDAEALRNEILVLAAGVAERDDAAVDDAGAAQDGAPRLRDLTSHLADRAHALNDPEAVLLGTEAPRTAVAASEERTVYTVPIGRLVLSTLLSGPAAFLGLIMIVALPATLLFNFDLLGTLLAALGGSLFATVGALFGLLGFFWTRINGGFHFTAGLSDDGLRLRHGLTETRRQTVPPGRVQAIRLYQPVFWRAKDWWRISINVAGYGDEQESVSILHPVATRQEALTAVWLILPDLGDPDPAGTLGLAMSGRGGEGGFLTSPDRARRVDPLQWRFRGVRATERALLIRRGRWERELYVVPHERTQSLGLSQGPLLRGLSLANVDVHSTSGPVKPVAAHLDVDDAMALLDAQAARAREGRRRQTPEQWREAVGL